MTLQQSGQISAQDIIVEESIQIVDTFNINTTLSRTLAKRPSGQIAFSDFYGKTNCAPGSIAFGTPGVYYWTVPTFGSLTVNVWGAGGGGGGDAGNGTNGGASVFKDVIAGGGGGGYGMAFPPQQSVGAGGQASGGSANVSGEAASSINGGRSAAGGAGGTGGVYYFLLTGRLSDVHHNAGTSGGSPGGGGGATNHTGGKFYEAASGGGGGAFASRSYQPYELPVNSTVQIIVGDRGIGADSYNNPAYGYGGTGYVHIDWNCTATPPAPRIPRDTVYNSYCVGYALYYTLADGNGGTYTKLMDLNSTTCGYVAPPDPGDGGYYQPSCFLIGSPVVMADGSIKMIEDITIGEWVRGAFGEHNQVLALDRPMLGNRHMYNINGEHQTTGEHNHLTESGLFGCVSLAESQNEKLWTHQEVITDQGVEEWFFSGIQDTSLITQFKLGDKLKTTDGYKSLDSMEPLMLAPETQLYNLVLSGSHTYYVQGYCVTGFGHDHDFDYRTWQPKETPWTADDYRNPKV